MQCQVSAHTVCSQYCVSSEGLQGYIELTLLHLIITESIGIDFPGRKPARCRRLIPGTEEPAGGKEAVMSSQSFQEQLAHVLKQANKRPHVGDSSRATMAYCLKRDRLTSLSGKHPATSQGVNKSQGELLEDNREGQKGGTQGACGGVGGGGMPGVASGCNELGLQKQ